MTARRPLPAVAGLDQARRALRRGDRLVRNPCGAWTLAGTGQGVATEHVELLRADRRLALQPGRDQLPGFAEDLAQTYACDPARRRRRAVPATERSEMGTAP